MHGHTDAHARAHTARKRKHQNIIVVTIEDLQVIIFFFKFLYYSNSPHSVLFYHKEEKLFFKAILCSNILTAHNDKMTHCLAAQLYLKY